MHSPGKYLVPFVICSIILVTRAGTLDQHIVHLVRVLMLSQWFDETCMSITFGSFVCYINMINEYNMNISTSKTKTINFKDKKPVTVTSVLENRVLEKVRNFQY